MKTSKILLIIISAIITNLAFSIEPPHEKTRLLRSLEKLKQEDLRAKISVICKDSLSNEEKLAHLLIYSKAMGNISTSYKEIIEKLEKYKKHDSDSAIALRNMRDSVKKKNYESCKKNLKETALRCGKVSIGYIVSLCLCFSLYCAFCYLSFDAINHHIYTESFCPLGPLTIVNNTNTNTNTKKIISHEKIIWPFLEFNTWNKQN
tara:strand:+ start:265 stop:879 length:615 start_codon:yes stop_codon:yes gene_type:complete